MNRLRSLDIFRGATVALMILVNNPGSWAHLYPPLAHAGWHGCTPTDLVFPFFLFAVGNALALVVPGLREGPAADFWRRIAKRTALIFAIGLFLNASPFIRWNGEGELVLRNFDTLRIMGVLQRIALCFGAAAAIVWVGERKGRWFVLSVAASLLFAYWLACRELGDPNDPYGLIGWFGTALDRDVLGAAHLYRGEGLAFDPEGLASTPPAIAQVLLGWWAGNLIQRSKPDAELVKRLFVAGTLLLVAAYVWQLEFPINKKIWTSSYVLFTSGAALLALALLVNVIELRNRPAEQLGWARFFEVFGRNPLFVFVLSGFVPRVLALFRWADGVNAEGAVQWVSPLPWLYKSAFANLGSDPRLGSFLFACANLAVYWRLAVWLDSRRIYIRV